MITRCGSIPERPRSTCWSAATAVSTTRTHGGSDWRYMPEPLPVTQFYRVNVDKDGLPFYNVYGGTQDNNTLGGPARTSINR